MAEDTQVKSPLEGLEFKQGMGIIAFDCDGVLKMLDGKINKDICNLIIKLLNSGWKVVVWSGGGVDYARGVARRANLEGLVDIAFKGGFKVDIAVDDQFIKLGTINFTYKE